MGFIVPGKTSRPVISDPFSKAGQGLTGFALKKSLESILSPRLSFELHMSTGKGGSSSKSNQSDSNNNGSSNGKGGRPHRSSSSHGSYVKEERGTTQLVFSSGIESGIVVNNFEPTSGHYSDLFIQQGCFFPSQSADSEPSPFRRTMSDFIYNEYLFEVQRAINYRSDRDFTITNFYEYWGKISSALEFYYMIDSIVSYCSNDDIKVKNRGILYLRSLITSDILSKYVLLGETIKQYPIPPNLLQYIRYMYQNFSFSPEDDFPIYRLGFRDVASLLSKGKLTSDYVDVLIDELNINGNGRFVTLLLKTFPSMSIDRLPLSSSQVIHDPNFITFWCNNTVCYIKKGESELTYTRTVSNSGQRYDYYLFGDNVDGLIFASQANFNESTQTIESGIWSPFNNLHTMKGKDFHHRCSVLCHKSGPDRLQAPASPSDCSQSGLFHCVYD